MGSLLQKRVSPADVAGGSCSVCRHELEDMHLVHFQLWQCLLGKSRNRRIVTTLGVGGKQRIGLHMRRRLHIDVERLEILVGARELASQELRASVSASKPQKPVYCAGLLSPAAPVRVKGLLVI